MMAEEKLTFEAASARAEELASLLESGTLSLEESLRCYEEGIALVKYCENLLEEAKLRICRLDD